MFVVVFFLLFDQYVDFLNRDLAISEFIISVCITTFKKTKKHPYTEKYFGYLIVLYSRWLQSKQSKVP